MQYLSTYDPSELDVLLRLDLDLPQIGKKFDLTRLEDSFATLSYLWQKKAKHVTVIAHRGHNPKKSNEFSLAPIAEILYDKLLEQKAFKKANREQVEEWLDVLENLRFDPREEKNDKKFAKELAKSHDIFVNDAFATSHREHTSIVGVPQFLPTLFGFQFEKEMTAMKKVTELAKRPIIFVLGGAKLETKLPLIEKIAEFVDVILLGGKLAIEAKAQGLKHRKMIVANMTEDTLDIAQPSAEQFERFVQEAKTLIWNGPMGKFEDGKNMAGTKYIVEAMARCSGYKMMGGGDTEAAVSQLKINEGKLFSHISAGGGAMMHYLAFHSLPAIDATKKK
jgi:phosphoglycerate kinase